MLFLICMQLGLLTPPFGLLLVHDEGRGAESNHHDPDYRAAMPYVLMSILILALIFQFPRIATWLPAVLSR